MKKVALVACSNGQGKHDELIIKQLKEILQIMNIETVESPCLYGYTIAKEKAKVLNACYKDESIDAIFDVSGGDLANEILPYLDYELISKSNKLFYGYSDLTTVINAIYSQTGKPSILFQIKHLVNDESHIQIERFKAYLQGDNDLFEASYEVLQGMKTGNHIVVGGNIRCFLKLAGTKYMPDLHHKYLFLEAMSGDVPQISTYIAQLYQIGAFDQVDGILLGTFLEMDKKQSTLSVYNILKQYISEDLFVAQTNEIGHRKTSKALRIG